MPRRSKDAFGVRVEANFAHEERQLDVLVILRLDLDVSGRALKRDLSRRLGRPRESACARRWRRIT